MTFPKSTGQTSFPKLEGKKLPLSDEVIVKIYEQRSPLWLAFLQGELDHAIIPKGKFVDVLKDGVLQESYKKKGLRVLRQDRPDLVFIGFNMEHPLLGRVSRYSIMNLPMAPNGSCSLVSI